MMKKLFPDTYYTTGIVNAEAAVEDFLQKENNAVSQNNTKPQSHEKINNNSDTNENSMICRYCNQSVIENAKGKKIH